MESSARLEALRRKMDADGVPASLITAPSNLRYLTGFEAVIDDGINAAAVVTLDGAWFFTDHRYTEAAGVAAAGTAWEVVAQRENLYVEVCELLHGRGIETLLFESSAPYGRFSFVSHQFGGSVRVVDNYVETIRQVKEPAEIERIAQAAALTDRAFDHICGYIAPGVTEAEIALELEFYMRRNGSDGIAFAPIVGAGPNGAKPHGQPGPRTVALGDLIVLDFGARIGGYCSDMTRTVAVGRPTDAHRRLYDAVLAANLAGIEAVRSGVPCAEVDRAAREVLEQAGLGGLFTHGLGHGVGLDIHEMPTVGRKSTESLRAGAVVTIEPGVYVPGDVGVRIEDLAVVEEAGCRLLSHAPKELIEI